MICTSLTTLATIVPSLIGLSTAVSFSHLDDGNHRNDGSHKIPSRKPSASDNDLSKSHVKKLDSSKNWKNTTVGKGAEASYVFNATASDNLAVYFGRTDQTVNTNLTVQCDDANIDIVILAFLTDIQGGGGYPDMGFGNLCAGQTSEMVTEGATGLLSCTDLAPQIAHCHDMGKKVLVGIGGANGNATFSNTSDASNAAAMLWDLFGAGSGVDQGLRPFGNVDIDGFDIDNESGDGDYYTDFATAMRTLYKSQASTSYYLSAAPACYFPDASQPLSMLNLMDWVWPQFYAAPSCNIGTDGFYSSVSAWSTRLVGPKLYIGSPDFPDGTSNGGYQDPDTFATTIAKVKKLVLSNFGGVMLWDGAYGHITKNPAGDTYIAVSKTALVA